MKKLTAIALVLFAFGPGLAHAAPPEGKPVPLFPKLTWGLSEQAALANGLQTYKSADTKADVIGLPSVKIGGVDFTAQAAFGRQDSGDGRAGLATIFLQHEGYVPTGRYDKFLHAITKGFLYTGRGSAVAESAVFYDAASRDSHLVVTSSDRNKVSLRVEIAPGKSK